MNLKLTFVTTLLFIQILYSVNLCGNEIKNIPNASFYDYEINKPFKRNYYGLFDDFKKIDSKVFKKELDNQYFTSLVISTNKNNIINHITVKKDTSNPIDEHNYILKKLEYSYGKFDCTATKGSKVEKELIRFLFNNEEKDLIAYYKCINHNDAFNIELKYGGELSKKSITLEFISNKFKDPFQIEEIGIFVNEIQNLKKLK